MKDRRDFLKLCAASVTALALPHGLSAKDAQGASLPDSYRKPGAIDRYIDPLPLPRRMVPVSSRAEGDHYRVRMLECSQQMHSQLPPTRFWGYEGHYPGPTFEATRDRPVIVDWDNRLPLRHMFEIDRRLHGAMAPSPAVRSVTHLHGSCTSSESDGLPEKWYASGRTARYHYPNRQPASTLWYHDHALGITRLNVYAGMSGFYLLRDEQERAMNLPSGEYEIPLLLQDRTLDEQAQLVYSATHEDGSLLPPGMWGPMFYGELPVVNGRLFPFLEVEPRPYRLRLLNGSNSRFLNIDFNLAKGPTDIPALVTFHQIGSDGGFLPRPAALNKLLLSPAERADVILDFSRLEGKTVTLGNTAPAPYPGWDMGNGERQALYEFMQFRVAKPLAADGKAFSLPAPVPFTKLEDSASITTRDFVLSEILDDKGRSLGVRINGKMYDDPVTETVKLGTVEKWRFINTTDDSHPMHIHLAPFQIQHRQGFNLPSLENGTLQLLGAPRPPAPNEAGWKDTAVVNPRDVLTVLVRFEGFTGRYVLHCHMLEHEDNDMMRPFEVVAADATTAKI